MVLYKRTQMNICNKECLSELSRQYEILVLASLCCSFSVLWCGKTKSTRTTDVDICFESPVRPGV